MSQHGGPVAKRYRLGILFVHGMGEQERGDTITEMGDALTEWLRRWLGPSEFRLLDASLRSRDAAGAGTPTPATSGRANATVVLGKDKDSPDAAHRWLLAESWWADAFRPASLGELVAWAIGVGPWLIASQAAGLRQRLIRAAPGPTAWLVDRAVFIAVMLVAALVAALITPLAIALLLFSLIPIPYLSDSIRGLARNLAGSFGDLLVFVRSPIRFAAISERVREDIAWLDRDCDRIMVVAHSQGSAVAWHAIRRTAQRRQDERARVALFLTFGQAFRKLNSLHRLHTRVGGGRQVAFAILAALSTLFLLIAGTQGLVVVGTVLGAGGEVEAVGQDVPFSAGLVAVSAAAVAIIQWLLARYARANDDKAEEDILEELVEVRAALPGFEWVDLWASADPAPNGPIFSRPVPGVSSFRIRNLASTTLDHSRYWSNVTEFVSAVAFRASSLVAAGPLGSDPIPGRLRAAAHVRDVRVTALAFARVGIVATFAAALVGLRQELPSIGAAILRFVGGLPLVPGWFAGWPDAAQAIVGALAVALAATLAWWLLLAGWSAVVRTDESRLFVHRDQIRWSVWAILWVTAAAAVPVAAILALTVLRSDLTFLVVAVLLAAIGFGVVVRLLGSADARLSDPPSDDSAQAGSSTIASR